MTTAVEDGTVFHPESMKNNCGFFVATLLRMAAFLGEIILPLREAQNQCQDDSASDARGQWTPGGGAVCLMGFLKSQTAAAQKKARRAVQRKMST